MIPSALTAQLQQGIADFLRYSFWSSTPGMEHVIDDLLDEPGGVTRGPYLSVKLPFVQGSNPRFFPSIPLPFPPHAHQEQAFERLGGWRKLSTLVATGTGSGKTECFLLPILDHCRAETATPGIKAILVYPMNALATDQAERIARLVHDNPDLRGRVTAGLYIGESRGRKRAADEKMGPRNVITDREAMEQGPPDILLTNYKMLDLLLLRPWVQGIWRHNARGVLRFLVVDELHTFDGAQGTDLACLIRRLKRRLQADDGSLCCVGTSATLGGADSRRHLLEYAGQVFGEPFDAGALIGESRLDAAAFLAGAGVEHTDVPGPGDLAALAPENYDDPASWIRGQAKLWFGDVHQAGSEQEWAVALGDRLKRHGAFRALLGLLDGHVVSLDDAVQSLSRARSAWREDPVLGRAAVSSLMGLVSVARSPLAENRDVREERQARGEPAPVARFLDVRVQLWQREMRRMVATVEARPRLRFHDDLDREQKRRHLPLVHCRDCGAMGWGTRIDRDKEHVLRCDTSAFYAAFFRGDPAVRFLYPAAAIPPGDRTWDNRPRLRVDSATLAVLDPDEKPEGQALELVACANLRQTDKGPKLHRDCPFCDARETLALVGFRAATLTSSAIDQLFASRFNDEGDKKLLAFSDSVQDAAHRAGFFGARTWRTNLRVALRQFVADGHEGETLAEVCRAFPGYWRERMDGATWAATFIAPNMTWLHEWDDLLRDGELSPDSELPRLIERRLTFEIADEFGLQATIGRSLPRTGAAAVQLDRTRLDAACAALLEPLRNEVPGLREISEDRVRGFVLGLLHHLRMRGGIHHPELPEEYLRTGGDKEFAFKLQKHLPSYGRTSRLHAFLTNHPARRRFDSWSGSQGNSSGWYERWVTRCLFAGEVLSTDAASVYPLVLAGLVNAGLLVEVEAAAQSRVWGVADSALRISTEVSHLRCDRCDHRLPVASAEEGLWEHAPCLTARCDGRYRAEAGRSADYFGRLYAHGDLRRIFAAEHTGLLAREERETVERQFKAVSGAPAEGEDAATVRKPWFPNLLSCTPTLEMGIDIGDLSSTFLCSVPPTQASYLQRIGRAGRRDGNSFVLTLAGARPHDLYFYAQPGEMMEGDVMPPGVFLDASAVLERQLTAFCFDRWVYAEGERAVLPAMLREVFTHLGEGGGNRFPHNLLAFIEREQPVILREFCEMFAGAISEATRAHLRRFLLGDEDDEAGLRWRILDVFQRERKQLDSLQGKARQIDGAVKKLKDNEARPIDFEDRLAKLEDEKEALLALVGRIRQRSTLEFLTDEGMLPNYAFPESAVRLSSVIWRKKKKTPSQGSKYDTWTYEYTRSPSSALSELAPGADFYAGGRHVRVDQVDITVSEVETWRFCDSCSHAQRDDIGDRAPACPACGSTNWVDDEQKLRLLPLRQVFANAPDKDSRIRDERDERQPRHFQRQILVDHQDVDRLGAWSIDEPSLPFGFELLRRATFRELNFGENSDQGQRRTVAGRDAVRPGFRICTRCGKVQPGKDGEQAHTLSCPVKTRNEPASIEECLYLYREFSSEALRMLLPMAEVGTKQQLNSFLAALQLGLRERFGGSVEHIHTTVYSEPEPGSSLRRQYLVLFDSVPGGTGYVKQLVTPAREGAPMPLFEALELARRRMEGCSCRSDPERDGCYKCLLAYRNARDMDDTSARVAVDLIGKILGHWPRLKPISSLSDVSVGGLMDSVLEARFVEALRQTSHKGRPNRLRHIIFREKPGYHLTVGDLEWNVETQCAVEHSHGCHIEQPVDFVLWPASTELRDARRPVAVFLDGFEFHKDRIGLDLIQRQCLLASGRFDVWSLTWFDLDEALGIPTRKPVNALHPDLKKLRDALRTMQIGEMADLGERNAFDLLLDDLSRGEELPWARAADTVLATRMQPTAPDHARRWKEAMSRTAPPSIRPLLEGIEAGPALFDEGELTPFVSLFAVHDGAGAHLLAEIDDREEHWAAPGFIEAWNGFLRLYQAMRFQPRGWFVSRSWRDDPRWSTLVRLRSGPGDRETWADEIDAEESFSGLCTALAAAGAARPEVGVDIPDHQGRVWAQAELVWEERKVAVVDRAAVAGAPGRVAPDWRVFFIDEVEAAGPVLAALGIQGGQ